MKTLYARREGAAVNIYDKENHLKATFTKEGYRPTKATKEIVLNCWKWKLNWQ